MVGSDGNNSGSKTVTLLATLGGVFGLAFVGSVVAVLFVGYSHTPDLQPPSAPSDRPPAWHGQLQPGDTIVEIGDAKHHAKVLGVTEEFGVFWPPWDLGNSLNASGEPLLHGELSVFQTEAGESNAFGMHVTLRRPSGERERIRWNKKLAFPEYSWMARVRVWDRKREWLWPNLPYLLRAHGEERVERYGGVDPGKGIDNDFAAVLIRPLDHESSETEKQEPTQLHQPLVSAEWHPVDAGKPGRISIVHVARSDVFIVRLLPDSTQSESGRLGVWLIYADFLEEVTPRNWPENGEYDGGILAYFEVSWQRASEGNLEFDIEHLVPPTDTGFDWASWSTGPSALEKNLELVYPSERSG